MKSFFFMVVFLFVGVSAFASPFLICDPQSSVEWYEITNLPPGTDGNHVFAETDGSIRLDFANIPIGGPYSIQVRACTVWGCSPYAPFVFTRSAVPSGVSGIRLTK
jgi:hypothetical protein